MSLEFFSRFLVEEGNESNNNANGDYSVSPKNFICTHTGNGFLLINKLVIFLKDTNNLLHDDVYGATDVLTNGITFFKQDNLGNQTQYIEFPVKANMDWGRYSTEIKKFKDTGQTFGAYSITWDFGSGININLKKGECLVMQLNDDFTGLNEHCFIIQGIQ